MFLTSFVVSWLAFEKQLISIQLMNNDLMLEYQSYVFLIIFMSKIKNSMRFRFYWPILVVVWKILYDINNIIID